VFFNNPHPLFSAKLALNGLPGENFKGDIEKAPPGWCFDSQLSCLQSFGTSAFPKKVRVSTDQKERATRIKHVLETNLENYSKSILRTNKTKKKRNKTKKKHTPFLTTPTWIAMVKLDVDDSLRWTMGLPQ
jgi:hypothetical protein